MFGRVGPGGASYLLLGSMSYWKSGKLQRGIAYGLTSTVRLAAAATLGSALTASSARCVRTRNAGDMPATPGAGAAPATSAPEALTPRPSSALGPPAARIAAASTARRV